MENLIWLPYADWLSANDRFDEAQEAYKKASRPDLSLRIIEFLTYNAVVEKKVLGCSLILLDAFS